ncbi:hypothetical protein [Spiroplasma endosymbiont of Nebria brevicollis]|uniref:hypothetical protein n=1 Tax=Spiroplasma endosymbiont of Nebria brevicollis TaxID=3066284 RepID=UPI00313BD409
MIACGDTKAPDVTDEPLSATAKEKIQTEFANLVNDGQNLRTVGDITNGDKIMKYLEKIGQISDTVINRNDSSETVTGFLEVLTEQVKNISNNLVTKYPELKPLFNGINPNDILTINTDGLDKLLTNKQFEWKNNDFGQGFDAKEDYGVTDWYHITADLKLNFTCLGENTEPLLAILLNHTRCTLTIKVLI